MYPLNELLSAAGLDEKEIPIFIYLTNCGAQSAGSTAKRLKLNRSTAYLILEKMVHKGYLQKENKDGLTIFSTVHPRLLVNQSHREISEDLIKLAKLEKAIIQCQDANSPTSNQPKATYYNGREGILKVMEQIIAEKPKLLRAYITKAFQDFMMEINYTANYHLPRIQNNIHINSLYPTSDIEENCLTDDRELRETRAINAVFDPGVDYLIFNDKVAIISMSDHFATVLESPALATSSTRFFDFAWAQACQI